MIRNIKETFPPKTGMWKSSFLQDPGYVEDVEDACCMLQECTAVLFIVVEDVKDTVDMYELQCRF